MTINLFFYVINQDLNKTEFQLTFLGNGVGCEFLQGAGCVCESLLVCRWRPLVLAVVETKLYMTTHV